MLILILWFLNIRSGAELQISLGNIKEAKGSIYVAVYDNESNFLIPEKVRDSKIVSVSNTGTMDIRFSNLPSGSYAISCFHDLNGNGKLDTNLFGIPLEPYGFSNNARPKFSAPNWAEVKFDLNKGKETQVLWLQ